ncbi:hypothetical protein BKA66DRAFT_448471 [Pyrenochaeta sp. MPI-SDFR-AT-0127]|nr:hypothetical protein BKA66DRAFT_448471 [Pyrenochaeta sp. MPI-SDFR-AT-0127]
MQDVYANCIINLSLAQVGIPNESCLNLYDFGTALPFEAETCGLIGKDKSTKCICTIVYRNYYREGLYDRPIGLRAWVLQERLLAVRVLSIGLGELFWDRNQLPNANNLIALSALVTRMGQAMDDVCFAGHFWKMMPHTLNWQVQPPLANISKESKGTKQIRTPSWSWASMDGPLYQHIRQDAMRQPWRMWRHSP